MFTSRQLCPSVCSVSCPPPVAEAWSQPCVTSCGDSRAVIHPPPVVITFPGPILSSCPQESIVGSAFPSGMGNSCGWGGFYGSRGALGYGAAQGRKFSYSSCSQGREFSSSSCSQRVRGCGFRSREPSQSQQEFPCSKSTKSAADAGCEVQTQD